MALVWYARLEGSEFRTVSESVNNQGRPRELLGQLKIPHAKKLVQIGHSSPRECQKQSTTRGADSHGPFQNLPIIGKIFF